MGAWRFTQLEPAGKSPAPRHLHAAAIIDGTFYIMGGLNKLEVLQDAWALPIADEQPKWRRLKLPKSKDLWQKRSYFGHAAYGSKLYLSAGTNHQNLNEVYDDVLVLDTEDETLTVLETDGETPPKLCRHSVTAMGGSLWMVGGYDGSTWLDSTWRLDLYAEPKPRWTLLEVTGFTPWRRSHGCLLPSPTAPGTLLLWGGGDGDSDFDDTYYLHTHDGYWGRVDNTTGDSDGRTQMACGVLPPGAYRDSDSRGRPSPDAHAIVAHGGFGGGGEGKRLDLLSLLTLDHAQGWRWGEMRTSGKKPLPRMGHTLHVINSSCMVIFGGTLNGNADVPTGGATNEVWLIRPNKLVQQPAQQESPPDDSSLPPPSTSSPSVIEVTPDVDAQEDGEPSAPPRQVVRELGVEKKSDASKAGKKKKKKGRAKKGDDSKDEV